MTTKIEIQVISDENFTVLVDSEPQARRDNASQATLYALHLFFGFMEDGFRARIIYPEADPRFGRLTRVYQEFA
jgi:hypothetical protein